MPRWVAGRDVPGLPTGAFERMVLDAIDGQRSIAAIADLVGLGAEDVAQMIGALTAGGAITIDPRPGPAPRPFTSPTAPTAPVTVGGSDAFDPSLDIAAPLQARILELFDAIDTLDHYALLGVPRDADRKAIKSAYYGFAAKFHTDRHFGKNLGPLKSKMEVIFGRATVAHDVLSRKEQRAEYDRYLSERDRTRAYEELLSAVDEGRELFPTPPPRVATPLPSAGRLPVAQAVQPDSGPMKVAPVNPARITADFERPVERPLPASVLDERTRKEALARRLGAGRQRSVSGTTIPGAPSLTPPRKTSVEEGKAAADAIKRLYEDRRDNARKAQAQRMLEAGEAALAKEDVVGAANHYRLAVQYTDDPAVHSKFKQISQKAREVLFDAYMKQARYEESQAKWKEAAASYAKAHEAHPDDADIAASVAQALRKEGRDLHRAARFGELAVQKNPNSSGFRVTLGAVYLDAGLFLRAKTELEVALRLSPEDAKIKELLVHVRKALA